VKWLALALVFLSVQPAFARARRRVSLEAPRQAVPRHAVIEHCLQRAGVRPPFKVIASLTVSRRGRVTRATLPDVLPTEESRACVVEELMRIRFPRRHARLVSMPLVFVGS
jgi:hypothetical protein